MRERERKHALCYENRIFAICYINKKSKRKILVYWSQSTRREIINRPFCSRWLTGFGCCCCCRFCRSIVRVTLLVICSFTIRYDFRLHHANYNASRTQLLLTSCLRAGVMVVLLVPLRIPHGIQHEQIRRKGLECWLSASHRIADYHRTEKCRITNDGWCTNREGTVYKTCNVMFAEFIAFGWSLFKSELSWENVTHRHIYAQTSHTPHHSRIYIQPMESAADTQLYEKFIRIRARIA